MAKKKTKKTKTKTKPNKKAGRKTTKTKPKTTRPKVKRKKGGGQTKYRVGFPDRALAYAEIGQFAVSRLAKKFRVSVPTIKNWIKDHPEFAAAVEEGKKIAVEAVDSTYYQMALGLVKKRKGKIPPCERAGNKILTANREEYKERRELTGADGEPLQLKVVVTKTYKKDDS